MKFTDWIKLREQAPPAPNAATPTAAKDDAAKTNTEIKQIIANNIGKPKRVTKMALIAKAKQMAPDPNIKPKDMKAIQAAIEDDEPQTGPNQK